MKKNLLSVIILALLVVNLALTGVMMFSTVSANKKTVALVDQIAAILNMEVKPELDTESAKEVSILDTDTYNIADEMVITLKKGEDGAEHECKFLFHSFSSLVFNIAEILKNPTFPILVIRISTLYKKSVTK